MNKKTVILGASIYPGRYSYIAFKRLLADKHEVIGIGKVSSELDGVKIYDKPIHVEDVHTLTLYLNRKNQTEYYDYIIALNPKRVIFNPGSENEDLERLLKQENIAFQRSCTLVLLSLGVY